MRSVILITCCFFMLAACKKENELEGVETNENKFENPENPYVTVNNAIQVNCTTIRIDILANEDQIPDTEDYDRFLIAGSNGDTSITQKSRSIFISAACNTTNEYKISLYQSSTNRTSFPLSFFFKTNP